MKFTIIVVLSNAILLVFILLGFFLPVFVPEPWNAGIFRLSARAAAVFFVLVLLAMNLLYAANAGFVRLWEKEDWPALARYLEKQAIERGRYRPFDVQFLVNTWRA